MNKKLLSLLLALCLAGTQVNALTLPQKAAILGLNVMRIGKDEFFSVHTDHVKYVPVERELDGRYEYDSKADDEEKRTPTFSQELSARFTKLSTQKRTNPSRHVNKISLANFMLSMTPSSLAAKAIQYSPREISLLKTAGFSATGALVSYLMVLIAGETSNVDFFYNHKNLCLVKNIFLICLAAISYIVAQNPELTASAIAEIKEKGFVIASGEFCENAIKNYSKDGSRRDRIAFVVKNVLPFIIFSKNIPATYFSQLIVGKAPCGAACPLF